MWATEHLRPQHHSSSIYLHHLFKWCSDFQQAPLRAPLLVNTGFNGMESCFFFLMTLSKAACTFISKYWLAFKNSSNVFTCLCDLMIVLFPATLPLLNTMFRSASQGLPSSLGLCSCTSLQCQAVSVLLFGLCTVSERQDGNWYDPQEEGL